MIQINTYVVGGDLQYIENGESIYHLGASDYHIAIILLLIDAKRYSSIILAHVYHFWTAYEEV